MMRPLLQLIAIGVVAYAIGMALHLAEAPATELKPHVVHPPKIIELQPQPCDPYSFGCGCYRTPEWYIKHGCGPVWKFEV